MAEIRVDRKQGPSPWVWVVGLLVLGLVVWGIIEFTRDDTTAMQPAEPAPPAVEQPGVQPAPTDPAWDRPAPPAQPGDPTTPQPGDPAAPGAPGTMDDPAAGPGTTDPGYQPGTGTGGTPRS